jgi:hypothetical protein
MKNQLQSPSKSWGQQNLAQKKMRVIQLTMKFYEKYIRKIIYNNIKTILNDKNVH